MSMNDGAGVALSEAPHNPLEHGYAWRDGDLARQVRHRLLMCPPTHFKAAPQRAQSQWQTLRAQLQASAGKIELIAPGHDLPDMPFTANAGLVLGNMFVPSRFRHPERRGEETRFIGWFDHAGYRIRPLPKDICFEGAGDALVDRGHSRLWLGYGHRTDLAAAAALERILEIEVMPLRLVNPRFDRLDSCLCPLRGGRLLYYPGAFDAASVQLIEQTVPAHLRLAVSDSDALELACNAVDMDDTLLLHRASQALQDALAGFGYRVLQLPLDEFVQAGASAKSLCLRLDE